MDKIFAVIVAILMFTGCTSMNKDECELANWNAIGYSEGVKGQSLSSFQEYQNDCAEHRVKADYQSFKQGYKEGLNEFCSMERGMNAALSGGSYNATCKRSKFPKYNEGFQAGIKQYCSYDRGIGSGSRGESFNSRCPSARFPTFNDGYQVGIKQYCSYDNGYQLGVKGKAINKNCSVSKFKDFSRGFSVGLNRFNDNKALQALESKLQSLAKEIEREQAKVVRAEAQIISESSTPEVRKRALDNIKLHQDKINELEYSSVEVENEIALLSKKLNAKAS